MVSFFTLHSSRPGSPVLFRSGRSADVRHLLASGSLMLSSLIFEDAVSLDVTDPLSISTQAGRCTVDSESGHAGGGDWIIEKIAQSWCELYSGCGGPAVNQLNVQMMLMLAKPTRQCAT